MGNSVLLNTGTEVHRDATEEDYALIYTDNVIRTGAKAGKIAQIGSNVTVCNGVIMPAEADVPDYTYYDRGVNR